MESSESLLVPQQKSIEQYRADPAWAVMRLLTAPQMLIPLLVWAHISILLVFGMFLGICRTSSYLDVSGG